MKPLSIRTSLTVWFVGLTGLLLVVFSATLYLGMRSALVTEFDARLQTRAEALIAVCEWEEDSDEIEFEMSPELVAEFTGPDDRRSIEVRTWPQGHVLHASGAPLTTPSSTLSQGLSFGFSRGKALPRPASAHSTNLFPAIRPALRLPK